MIYWQGFYASTYCAIVLARIESIHRSELLDQSLFRWGACSAPGLRARAVWAEPVLPILFKLTVVTRLFPLERIAAPGLYLRTRAREGAEEEEERGHTPYQRRKLSPSPSPKDRRSCGYAIM